jgi:hypothetical protein
MDSKKIKAASAAAAAESTGTKQAAAGEAWLCTVAQSASMNEQSERWQAVIIMRLGTNSNCD